MDSQGDDIAIRTEKKAVLDPHRERIQEYFNVSVEYDHLSKDGTQWLLIKGKQQDRKIAKDYIKAMCNPAENLDMRYPPYLESLIKNPPVHRKLEKQSGAVILFSTPGILNIMGSDSLSVTLAMSAVEELINKYLNTEQQGEDKVAPGPVTNLSSQRLDQELRRLSSSTKTYVLDDDYSNTNDAVKRTILSWMNDSIHDDSGDAQQREPETEGPGRVNTGPTANTEYKTPSDFNSNSKFLTDPPANQTFDSPVGRKSSSSSSVQILDTPPRRKGGSDIELLSPEVFVATQRVSQSHTISDVSIKNRVCHDFGTSGVPLTVTDLESEERRSPRTGPHPQQPVKPVVVRGSSTIGRPGEEGGAQGNKYTAPLTFSKISKESSSQPVKTVTKESTGSSSSIGSSKTIVADSGKYSPDVCSEDYLLAHGLQNGFEEDDIQSVFAKFGTNMRLNDFLQELNSVRSDRERKRIEEKKGNVTPGKNFEFPKAPSVAQITTDKMLKPEILKDKSHMAEYFSQLTKDFEEEGNSCDMDELKMRNFERQRLLREAYTKQVESAKGSVIPNSQPRENMEDEKNGSVPEAMDLQDDSENKKRKHANKGAVPRKSRFSPPTKEQSDLSHIQTVITNNYRQDSSVRQNQSPTDFRSTALVSNYSMDSTQTRNQMQGGRGGHQQRKGYQSSRNIQDERSPSPAMRNQGKQDQERRQLGAVSKPLRSNLRYIVIDGSNVAFSHGNQHVFSCKGIEIVVNYFLKRGHTEVTAFVPQSRTRSTQNVPIEDQHLLEDLRKKGNLVYTPARKVAGKTILAHDDNFVIRLAAETDGIVVTNDNFRDHYKEKFEWRDVIENRILMYSFVGNFFMPADDPLGAKGPSLDNFLLKDTVLDISQCTKDKSWAAKRAQSGSPRGRFHDNSKMGGGFGGGPNLSYQQGGGGASHVNHQGAGPNLSYQQGGGGASHVNHQGAGPSSSQSWGNMDKQRSNKGSKKGGGNMTWQQQHLMTQDKPGQQQQQQSSSTQGGGGGNSNHPHAGHQSTQNKHNGSQQRAGQFLPVGGGYNKDDMRLKSKSDELFKELCQIFPSDHDKVQRVLQNHPGETDLNKLSLCIVEIM